MLTPIVRDDSDPRWQILCDYVVALAEKMGLAAYQIKVCYEPPCTDGAVAQVWAKFAVLAAEIAFADSFFTQTQHEQRHIVVHELTHVIDSGRHGCVDLVQWEMSPASHTAWYRHYDIERERVVDWTARLIDPSMPLPDWGEHADTTTDTTAG